MRFGVLLLVFPAAVQACEVDLDDEMEKALWTAYEAAFESADTGRRALLAKAQGAWLDYRSANCELMADRADGVDAEPYTQCVTFMTRERTLELRLICRTGHDAADCDLTF